MRTCFVIGLVFMSISGANAQTVLNTTPIDLAGATLVNVTRLGDAVVISGRADLSVKGAPRTFESLLPLASQRFGCSTRNWVKAVTFSNVSIGFTGGMAGSALPVSVDAQVELCGLLPTANVRVTIPISTIPIDRQSKNGQFLSAGDPEIAPIGFVATSAETLPFVHSRIVDMARKKVNPIVLQTNAAIARLLTRASASLGGQAVVQSVTLESDGSTLNVHVTFSGQVPTRKMGGWLGGI